LIDNDLQNKKSGQLSKKIELSTLVEQSGVISNFFKSDLELLNKKITDKIALEVIGTTVEQS